MSDTKVFPNGFRSWMETFYEVVEKITLHINFWSNDEDLEPDDDPVFEARKHNGTNGLYELAEEWADEFEELNKGREWVDEFFDDIEDFVDKKITRE